MLRRRCSFEKEKKRKGGSGGGGLKKTSVHLALLKDGHDSESKILTHTDIINIFYIFSSPSDIDDPAPECKIAAGTTKVFSWGRLQNKHWR